MLFSQIFIFSALSGIAMSQAYLEVLSQFPACAATCSAKFLTPAGCELTNLTSCFCTSHDLQYDVGVCILQTCNTTEQYISSKISQDYICKGVPVPSRVAYIVRSSVIIAAVAYPIIILRFVSRIMIAHRLWWDDWMILAAVFFMIPNTTIAIYTAYQGFGKHFYNVPAENIIMLGKMFYVSQFFYVFLQNLPKFSILFLYMRIFPTPRFRVMVQIAIGWMTCHTLIYIFTVAFQCVPVQANWDTGIPAKCLNVQDLSISGASLSIFEDLAIMLLPVYELYNLNLNMRKRIALIIMFALGSFACITSMIRLQYVVKYGRSMDNTWDSVDIVIWSEIEMYMAVICACLMCIRPLIIKYFPAIFPSTKKSSDHSDPVPGNPSWGQKRSSRVIQLGDSVLSSTSTVKESPENGEIHVMTEFELEMERKSHSRASDGHDTDRASGTGSEDYMHRNKDSIV